ncbi:type III restriction-modification system endonuclease [Peptoniphilus vaginalis]|uniref:type III restriction-modification system endonuclease n=1 Tax=Peptoniphilus vaginalis TaxID=1756987 RepID=UPI0023F65EF4|nr:DEAD/DEAH box helicase family protein [Peptoniphilus vaginalis]
MKIQFKNQKFQEDAAKSVVEVFNGQPYKNGLQFLLDINLDKKQVSPEEVADKIDPYRAFRNYELEYYMDDKKILDNIAKVQRENDIKESDKLIGKYNLNIEMETGVGKTYTYIKTMYELNKAYGWTKFIIVVPSIAIREGVYKSFQMTEDHFYSEYNKKINYFIYNSKNLSEIANYARSTFISVMIINSQAFNAKGQDVRKIRSESEYFNSRVPLEVIAKTNPILIIDEPQSVEGKKTKEGIKEFNPLFILRYSATHKDKYNLIYRLDAIDAYNKRLVKKIEVKGVKKVGEEASNSYLYLEEIRLSKNAPDAFVQIDYKNKSGVKKRVIKVNEGDNLFAKSNYLEEYRRGFTVKTIDGRDGTIEFLNGIKINRGEVIGDLSEDIVRRIQIRETILSHINKEKELFYRGIKVLSLFFIDQVKKYKQYDESNNPIDGDYAKIFEEEYKDIIENLQFKFGEDEYADYLSNIQTEKTHAGYFSIDKKGKFVDAIKDNKTEKENSSDVSAYELIMKNKELLLNRDPNISPVRFIFSHSALREGWDNPNVFQICTLKQSNAKDRKRQEIGRGMRLCVNDSGIRMDEDKLGKEVQEINTLTVIASESYEEFADKIQKEYAEASADRPEKVTQKLFDGRKVIDNDGNSFYIDDDVSRIIYNNLLREGYIDDNANITEKYYDAKKNGEIKFSEKIENISSSIEEILDNLFNPDVVKPVDARKNNINLELDKEKFNSKEFRNLWEKINSKSFYTVNFDTKEIIKNSVDEINSKLMINKIYFEVKKGSMENISSKDELLQGQAFREESSSINDGKNFVKFNVSYDLVGKIVDETGLTRRAIVEILKSIRLDKFEMFKYNPEKFIAKVSQIINNQKASEIIQHISYNKLDNTFDTDIFTVNSIRGNLNENAIKVKKNLYDYLVYDSKNEKEFAESLDTSEEVFMYVKLPSGFYISTPVGKYNPDWAIVFNNKNVKHIYFVAETKGNVESMELRNIEKAKIDCAKRHFKAISNGLIKYDVVNSYEKLMEIVKN